MNKAILTANLTRDPEIRYTPDGLAVCRLGLANNTKSKKGDEVLFIDCTVFGKTAEHCANYLRKGRPVLVEGRIKRDEWEDKDTGAKKHRTGIIADRVEFLGSRSDSQNEEPRTTNQKRPQSHDVPPREDEDDVPF